MSKYLERYNFFVKYEKDGEEAPWMMTLADLLSLILVFFIMINSTKIIDSNNWKGITDSMDRAFNSSKIIEHDTFSPLSINQEDLLLGSNINYLYTVISERIASNSSIKENVVVDKLNDKIIIHISGESLFEGDKNNFSNNASVILLAIGESIEKINNKVEIVVNFPKNSNVSDSLWSKSLNRAAVVAENLQSYGYLSKIDVFASENDNLMAIKVDGKIKFADRVDVIISKSIADTF